MELGTSRCLRHLSVGSGFLSLFCLLGSTALGTVIELAPSEDNTLYESGSGAFSNGKGAGLFAGKTNQGLSRRAVLAFDLGQIPAGSAINTVTLKMTVTQTSSGAQTVSLHRLSKNWGEGTSNAGGEEGAGTAATAGDATWIHTFYDGARWDSPGGDFAAQSSGNTSAGGDGDVVFGSTAGLIADVQHWIENPSENFGWLVMGNETVNKTAKRFGSRESANPPLLSIDFTPPEISLTHELYFPQFGAGDGFFSQIILVNPDSQTTVHARITLRGDSGQPLEVPLNGQAVPGGILEADIPASSTRFFETPSTGSLQVGSAVVASDQPLTGVILFGGAFGLAGVLASDDFSTGFYGPVEVRLNENVDTGVAIQNLDGEAISVNLELISGDGLLVGTATIDLPPYGKTAAFVSQLFAGDGIDFNSFKGTVRSVPTSDISAVLIQNRIVDGVSQFATLPVEERPVEAGNP